MPSSNENKAANMNGNSTGVTGVRGTSNMVYIVEMKCTCGKWHDNKYACCHAMAYLISFNNKRASKWATTLLYNT